MAYVAISLQKACIVEGCGFVDVYGERFIRTKQTRKLENQIVFVFDQDSQCAKKSIDCRSLVDMSEPLFEYVDSHDPGMQIRETTRNKGFRIISNWFIDFCAFLDQEYQYIQVLLIQECPENR